LHATFLHKNIPGLLASEIQIAACRNAINRVSTNTNLWWKCWVGGGRLGPLKIIWTPIHLGLSPPFGNYGITKIVTSRSSFNQENHGSRQSEQTPQWGVSTYPSICF